MVTGFTGWFVLLIYVLLIAAVFVGAYVVIRAAVLSALKAHTRWVDLGKQ